MMNANDPPPHDLYIDGESLPDTSATVATAVPAHSVCTPVADGETDASDG